MNRREAIAARERRETIECSIARWWPDAGRIIAETGAGPAEVRDVVRYLELIENTPRSQHDCATHPAGSLACHDEHNCWCPECKQAAQLRAKAQAMSDVRSIELRAHSAYEKARAAGQRIGDMPAWVVAGQRAYDKGRKNARKEPAA